MYYRVILIFNGILLYSISKSFQKPNFLNSPRKHTSQLMDLVLRPNKKISVFWVTSLKNLGRVSTQFFLIIFFPNFFFMHFERRNAFQNA